MSLLRRIRYYSFISQRIAVGYLKGYPNLKTIKFKKHHDVVHVMGNGPSMNVDSSSLTKHIDNSDFYCVNNFCDHELYSSLKPVCYFFLDKYFYSENAHKSWIKKRESTFKRINEVTDWEMQIFIPYEADEDIFKKYINRTNISIVKVNLMPTTLRMDQWKGRFLLSTGFFTPPDYNVLIYAIYFSVWAKYKKINIWGADLSFHKDVDVDQDSNDLIIHMRHFNEKDKIEVLKKNPEKKDKLKMSELLEMSAITFRAHEIINEFAVERSVEIINRSNYSLIDAYKRKEKY
jgi:hypothetical protein